MSLEDVTLETTDISVSIMVIEFRNNVPCAGDYRDELTTNNENKFKLITKSLDMRFNFVNCCEGLGIVNCHFVNFLSVGAEDVLHVVS